jgi:octaprenyl-diphosphate synthase
MSQLAPPLVDLYAPIRDDLAAAQRIFDDELCSELPFVNELCDTVRSYRGKMLRPAVLLLSAKATGRLTPVHHTLAAVAEMVHIATLVHDDVLDEADERRRSPTVRTTAGNVAAILLGDYLISHAFHLCSGLDSQYASRRIGAATNTVCEGELLQNRRRGSDRLSESEYLDIVRRKTGTLTAVSCELGAYYAGARESVVDSMRAYGMSVGIAFQIIDDVLDIAGNQGEVGKTLGLDLMLGKLTLPAIHCLANANAGIAEALRSVLAGQCSPDAQRVRAWLEETGSVQYALRAAKRYVADAIRRLDVVPPGDARASLVGMAEFIVERRF